MSRLIAIGDIHGEYDKLQGLLDCIQPTTDDRLVFLGDYIDRGPKSCEVVLRLMRLVEELPRTILLQGNHENFLLRFLVGPKSVKLMNNPAAGWPDGGVATMASYLRNQVSIWDHLSFFSKMPFYWETDTFYFCHAGVDPKRTLDNQLAKDLLHIRHPFLTWPQPLAKMIVHGHSYSREPFSHPHRIGIDTGSKIGGALTSVVLPEKKLIQFI